MRRIVISGAGGFLGQNIINEASARHIPVLAITSKDINSKDEIEVMDTYAFLNCGAKLTENDVFINCLFPTNADGIKMANGLKAVYDMITAAKNNGAKVFINISSQSVYPANRVDAASEETQLSLETPYAVGKYSTEYLTDIEFTDSLHTNIRLASLIGIDYEQRIINRMITQALDGHSLNIVGGMQRYGFLDVRDAAAGIVKMVLSDFNQWKTVYNLGTMESYTLLNVVDKIIYSLKSRGISADYQITQGVDNRNSSIDASMFMNDFQWEPKISLDKTIEEIIDYKIQRKKL